jgi:creatinine amidohydrolase
MHLSSLNWQQVEEYLKHDDRCVLPIGSTEQHAFLSLSTDSILAEKVSLEAAEPLGIPVFPVLHYGSTPSFMAYPGTVSLRLDTLYNIVKDILDSLVMHGFKRILIVNGHGGNAPVANYIQEWKLQNPDIRIKFHNWWNAPKVWAKVMETDPLASHASWMENFPWTRIAGIQQPQHQKPMVDMERLRLSNAKEVRELLGDGNFAGLYQRSDEEMKAIWNVAVMETRELLEGGW